MGLLKARLTAARHNAPPAFLRSDKTGNTAWHPSKGFYVIGIIAYLI